MGLIKPHIREDVQWIFPTTADIAFAVAHSHSHHVSSLSGTLHAVAQCFFRHNRTTLTPDRSFANVTRFYRFLKIVVWLLYTHHLYLIIFIYVCFLQCILTPFTGRITR
uniref:Uncharacterized protein n=1 Tax=Schistocephalus solidus TaxID=70667 RepID=A0A0X3Q087_SCHSO